MVNRAYLVFVAVDQDGKPIPVPPYEPEDLEPDEREAAARRRELRLQLREAARMSG
jgi:acyl-CoA hydrolase